MKNTQRGFITPLILALIAILLVGGGVYVYTQNKQESQPEVVSPTTQTTQPTTSVSSTQDSSQFSLSSKIAGTDTNSTHVLYSVVVSNRVARGAGDWTLKLSCPSGVNTVKFGPDCGVIQRVSSGPTWEVWITNSTNQPQTVDATAQLLSGVDNVTSIFTGNNTITLNPVNAVAVQSSITVLSPKGGEVYPFGSDIPFTWKRNVMKDMIAPIAYLDSVNGGYVDTAGNFLPDVSGANLPNVNSLVVQTGVITTSKSPMPLTGGKFKVVICEYPKNTNNRAYPTAPPLCASSKDFTISPFNIESELAPTASVTANPTSITAGQATTLTTSSSNARGCAGTGTDGSKFYGTGAVSPTVTTTYTFTCYESPDKVGRSASASVTVNVSPAPTSTNSPYVNTATMESGNNNIDGIPYMRVVGTGFTTSSKIHISGNGFDGFLSPVQAYAAENGSNGTNITVVLPSNIDTNKQYSVYVSNGSTTSNTVSTTKPFQG